MNKKEIFREIISYYTIGLIFWSLMCVMIRDTPKPWIALLILVVGIFLLRYDNPLYRIPYIGAMLYIFYIYYFERLEITILSYIVVVIMWMSLIVIVVVLSKYSEEKNNKLWRVWKYLNLER